MPAKITIGSNLSINCKTVSEIEIGSKSSYQNDKQILLVQ